jgi:hypothetical protein
MKSLTTEEWDAIESGRPLGDGKGTKKDKAVKCFSTRAVESFEVLNDLVVDRGPSPFVSQLELFGAFRLFSLPALSMLTRFLLLAGDEHHMTTVQADGLTVSTPTGSTAYSVRPFRSLPFLPPLTNYFSSYSSPPAAPSFTPKSPQSSSPPSALTLSPSDRCSSPTVWSSESASLTTRGVPLGRRSMGEGGSN